MPAYKAPLRDIRFVLHELLDDSKLTVLPGYAEATPELVDSVLDAAASFCEEQLVPLNRPGDEIGSQLANGVVTTPPGFKEAYKAFAEGGWISLASDPEYGGQGLPKLVSFAVEEIICSANLSFGMFPGLSNGAYNALALHGSDELKSFYLPKLTTGEWSGTMCLTEPQCGTDLGLVRTKAEPQSDGSFKITGNKIFISAGEHDLTDNILHLVLARLPDAPAGTRGISLFLVPKFMPKPDGSLGPRNAVSCIAIEKKMGIHASPTCQIAFDGATGWLVGRPHKGMSAMFTMMNAARLGVGVQGLGIAEAAYQGARDYAKQRLQGRAPQGAQAPDKPADPIIVHSDIRRMLLTIRSKTEAARALALWVGQELDISLKHPDPAARAAADDLVALLTPIVKAALTDLGFEAANLGMQVWGGHGYIRDNGMEQFSRDARITQIYEGTNGIQALDLVGRKLGLSMGRLLRRFFHPVGAFIETSMAEPAMGEFVLPLAKCFARLQQATAFVAETGMKDPEAAAAVAPDYLKLFSYAVFAYLWARMAKIALAKQSGEEAEFYKAKLACARFYLERILPEHSANFAIIMTGKGALAGMPAEAF
ncbi:acyl-CoA dehydrogenase [Hypericibacter terrae]|uniref:3-methylmercaptopropionyl-CoA dehydrogenase n=1 Tax=Hypericibacter terrae TaxID=2602015 RepID=A0A5J6MQJ0_9PROT|nr:acyl-CoA dehydrogenase C-terminal domain-containing protein [Hypericibacter terrae]QEX19623.1 acyl-CoA dehydrogenase [Hypericibacter terrae]